MDKLPPWSASSIDSFVSCPKKYYHLRVAKDVKDFPPSDAVLLGRKLHKAFEDAVNLGTKLPPEYSQYSYLVDKIRALPGDKNAEIKLAVDENFNAVEYFSKQAWSRGAADLVVLKGDKCLIIDYKTGKRKDSNQLALYAAYAFAKWPEIKRVITMYVWLKTKQIDQHVYDVSEKETLWQMWLPATRRLKIAYDTGKWEAKPSGLCRGWCPCKDCEYCEL